MQSKKLSHLEAFTNQAVGLTISWNITYWVLPLIGVPFTPMQATQSSAIFFLASYVRIYGLRRLFNKLVKVYNEKRGITKTDFPTTEKKL